MIPFLVMATVLVLIALVVLLRSVFDDRDDPSVAIALRTENIAIAREQLDALDASKASGAVADDDYVEERRRIETTLSSELEHDGNDRRSRSANLALVALIVVCVPACAVWLYAGIGTPAALVAGNAPTPATGDAGSAAPALADLIPRLEQRLAEQPDDVMGWRLLGRTYIGMEQFERAIPPLERALSLAPDHAGTHTQLAEAQAMRAGGNLNGAALESLERAHSLEPEHEQTLWLLGIARQQAGRHAEAITLLGTLRDIAGAAGNTQAVTTVDEYLAASRAALGQDTPSAPTPSEATPSEATPSEASLTLRVSLGDAAAAATEANQTVFVYARAADGPPMPLAVQRLTVADLPLTLTLDESMAMLPTMTLAGFAEVVVGARVSTSGQPTPSSDDWSVETNATVGEDGRDAQPLVLTIADRLP